MHEDATVSVGLTRWLDRLIHPRLLNEASPEVLRRARVMAGVSLCISVMSLLSVFLFGHHPLDHPAWITPAVALACGVCGLFALKVLGRDLVASMSTTFGLALMTIPVLLPLGGIASRSAYWLALGPLVTMFLLGPRWAFVNLVLLIGQLVLLFMLPSLGVDIPPTTYVAPKMLLMITTMFSVTLFFVGWAFESARRHANEAMIASAIAQKELEVARDAAELANQSKSQFISTMSHELRTPLNTILGYTELLLEEAELSAGLEPHRRDLEHINASGRHLLRMVDDVLTLSSLDRGALEVAREEVELEPIFTRLRARFEAAAISNSSAIVVECGVEKVRTDPKMLEACLAHLLDNACRVTHGGTVTLSAQVADGCVVFAVVDTGPGIDAADHSGIFVRFQKLAHSTPSVDGSGLGLTITRALTERLGGSLSLSSEPGVGSEFRLVFPLD